MQQHLPALGNPFRIILDSSMELLGPLKVVRESNYVISRLRAEEAFVIFDDEASGRIGEVDEELCLEG